MSPYYPWGYMVRLSRRSADTRSADELGAVGSVRIACRRSTSPAAITVRPAAAAPIAGLISWARITEAISRTNHPKHSAQGGRVDEHDEAAADQGADDGGGGDEGRQAPVDLLAGEVSGEAGERLHRDDDQ